MRPGLDAMAAKKTQKESEQPAKVYQLDAVQAKVDSIDKQVTEGFKAVNDSLQALILKSNTQVTPQQLADNIAAIKKSLEDELESTVKDAVEKIHLEYKPIKDNNRWLIRAISAQGIIIVAQIIVMFYITRT